MKRTTVAILVVVAAALWVGAAAQSESVINVKEGAEKVEVKAEEAKDQTHSWVGWAYQKFTQGLKINAGKATDTAGDVTDKTVDAAKSSTNIMNDAAIESSGSAAEKAADIKNSAGQTIQMATEKAENAQAKASEKMNQAADMAGDMFNQAKEKAEL